MGYLTIKQIKDVKINIEPTNQYYSLGYNTNYIKLSSILLNLKGVSITENRGFYININDEKSIHDLTILDTHLSKHISNYKSILHTRIDKNSNVESKLSHYLFLKKNHYLDNFMKLFTGDEIYINIIKLKKTASYTFPIVYVL
tara:strand:- start:323 stop:751 length:429 start_codon:yes stop_codon:yes gene_type:complete